MAKHTKVKLSELSRRDLVGLLGTSAAVSVAGCASDLNGGAGGSGDSGSGGGSGGDSEFAREVGKIDFTENWEERRFTDLDGWSIESRQQIPEGDALYEASGWIGTESVKSATWEPPAGWDDTIAGDVDKIQILNYGDMQFDPATAATDAMFENVTGITMERIQVVVDQAIPKAAAFLSAGQGDPNMLHASTSAAMSTYAENEYLQPVDFVQATDEMWEPYLPLSKQTFIYNDHLWGGPANVEGNPVHVRVDLLEEQGVDASVIDAIRTGEWTWDELETVMAAFEGTDVHAWGFRGSSLTYTERDWRILWYQTGGQYVQDDGTVAVNANGGGLIALEKAIEWRENGWLSDATTTWTQGDLADGFLSGGLAMVPVATDLFADASQKYSLGDQYVLAPPPKGTDGPDPQHATYGGGPVTSINAFAPAAQKVAGALFQDARFSYENGWWEYVVESNMSWPKSVYDDAAEVDAVEFSKVRRQAMEVAKNEVFPQQRALVQKVSQELQLAYAGDKEPQAALDAAQEYINTILGQ